MTSTTLPQIRSLNFVNRRNHYTKIVNENIQIFKRLNLIKPSIQAAEHQKHFLKQKKYKKLVMEGPQRQSVVQAARDMI